MELHIKNNVINEDVIIRGRKYLAVSLPIRYMLYIGMVCSFCLSIIFFVFSMFVYAMGLLLAAIFLFLIYHYVLKRNTKIIIEQMKEFKNEYNYDLIFHHDYIDMIMNEKTVQHYQYKIFKQIFMTNEEYILITESRNFIAIQKKNLNCQEKKIFMKVISDINIKKLTKLD